MAALELVLDFCREHPVFITTWLALLAFTTALVGAIVMNVLDHLNGRFDD